MSSALFLASLIKVLCICLPVLAFFHIVQITSDSWISMLINVLCLLFGAVGMMILNRTSYVSIGDLNPWAKHNHALDIYGLDHGRLNIMLPPQTMWMNMGFWKDTSDFPAACEGLLFEVLKAAELLPEVQPFSQRRKRAICLLDLGFGCGDQIRSLLELRTTNGATTELPEELLGAEPLIDRYVGITLNQSQFNYAKKRIMDSNVLSDPQRVRIFCADAAQPSKWSAKLCESVAQLSAPPVDFISSHQSRKDEGRQPAAETWVLALDTMYHFFPSREPVLEYAYRELGASSMAFDLLVSDSAPRGSRLLLALFAMLMGCPIKAFMTETRYRDMLKTAGYGDNNIHFKDISEHVFAPLARYLDERDKSLQLLGLSLGVLGVAKWIFAWWARSGLIRGMIVVARR